MSFSKQLYSELFYSLLYSFFLKFLSRVSLQSTFSRWSLKDSLLELLSRVSILLFPISQFFPIVTIKCSFLQSVVISVLSSLILMYFQVLSRVPIQSRGQSSFPYNTLDNWSPFSICVTVVNDIADGPVYLRFRLQLFASLLRGNLQYISNLKAMRNASCWSF